MLIWLVVIELHNGDAYYPYQLSESMLSPAFYFLLYQPHRLLQNRQATAT